MDTKNVLIKELYKNTDKYENSLVQISGWIRTIRDSKNFGFIEINDGSFFKNVQIVFDSSLSNFEKVKKLSISSSIICTGKFVKTENAKHCWIPSPIAIPRTRCTCPRWLVHRRWSSGHRPRPTCLTATS